MSVREDSNQKDSIAPDAEKHRDRVANVLAAMIAAGLVKEAEDLGAVTTKVSDVLLGIGTTSEGTLATPQRPTPAVAVKKSITPDYIVCLEDGKKLKMLKRHLKTAYDMSPEQYRERWGLPPDYPMTAPSYSARRSDLAKTNGLGRGDWRQARKAA